MSQASHHSIELFLWSVNIIQFWMEFETLTENLKINRKITKLRENAWEKLW
jgi:hypothetical protein